MNATPRPWTIATELQQARECVAATINQDEMLTIQEAREHASQALDHIEQAEEAFDAMKEALQEVDDYFSFALQRRPPLNPLLDKIKAALALAKGEQ
jgi:hypothetical protein